MLTCAFGAGIVCVVTDIIQLRLRAVEETAIGDVDSTIENAVKCAWLVTSNFVDICSSVFFSVWGVAITIAIFLIEISNTYHCGISMKYITRWAWKDELVLGVAEYLILAPIMFLSNICEWRFTSMWCVAMVFIGMIYMLAFFQFYMRTGNAQKIVIEETIERIREFSKGKRNVTYNEVDILPVTEMLKHVDYMKKDETQILIDTLVGILENKKGKENVEKGGLANTLVATWVKHMIISVGMQDEFQKDRIVNLVYTFWKRLTGDEDALIQSYERRMRNISYSLQILIPFMDIGTKDAANIMIRIWNIMGKISSSCLIYLLLYTEFRYHFIDGKIHDWVEGYDHNLQFELEKIQKGEDLEWNEDFAWQCWLDWGQYDKPREDIGVQQFGKFSKSVKILQKKQGERVHSIVLLSIIGGTTL